MGADGSSGTSRPTMPDIKTLALEIIDGLIRSALDLDMQSEYEEAIEDVDVLLTAALKERDERLVTAAREAVFEGKYQTPRAMLVRGHAVAIENEIPDLGLPDAEIEKQEKSIADEAAAWHELASKLDALNLALRELGEGGSDD